MRNPATDRTELLRRWVEALRSGDYSQAHEKLRDGQAHCCLGVLCEVSGLGWWRELESPIHGAQESYRLPGDPNDWTALLPPQICALAGIVNEEQWRYVTMNDEGQTFATIAEAIEKNHPDVFPVPSNA